MRVAVVGGGLAGLAAAHTLVEGGARVTVLESAPHFGGQVRTARLNGWLIEDGAEGFPARQDSVPTLCAELGLDGDLIDQETRQTLRLDRDVLTPLEPGEGATILSLPVEAPDLGGGLRTLRGGMETLVAALSTRVRARADMRLDCPVTGLRPGGHPQVLGPTLPALSADAVVVALPPGAAVPLLAPLVGTSAPLSAMRLASSVSVTLALPRPTVSHSLDATGFVVPGDNDAGLLACTFASSKFAGRAGPEWCLLRAFFRPGDGDLDLPEPAWVERAVKSLARVLGMSAPPAYARVARWPRALPRFTPTHAEDVARLRERLEAHPWLQLAGAAVDGGGVAGAIRSGHMAALRLLQRTPAG